MISTIINMDGGCSRAFVADSHKAKATTVPVRLLPSQSALGVAGAMEVFGVAYATLGRTGGSLD